jgi:hypothetical protein
MFENCVHFNGRHRLEELAVEGPVGVSAQKNKSRNKKERMVFTFTT